MIIETEASYWSRIIGYYKMKHGNTNDNLDKMEKEYELKYPGNKAWSLANRLPHWD